MTEDGGEIVRIWGLQNLGCWDLGVPEYNNLGPQRSHSQGISEIGGIWAWTSNSLGVRPGWGVESGVLGTEVTGSAVL